METTMLAGMPGDACRADTVWRATAEALARELVAVRGRLATIERALGLSGRSPVVERCPCRCRVEPCALASRRVAPLVLAAAPARRTAEPAARAIRPSGLSRREAEVLGLLASGRSNRQIAWALSISPRTVQRHVATAYSKLGAHNRAEATAYALRHGLA